MKYEGLKTLLERDFTLAWGVVNIRYHAYQNDLPYKTVSQCKGIEIWQVTAFEYGLQCMYTFMYTAKEDYWSGEK